MPLLPRADHFAPRLEGLEAREVPAVHAFALDHTLYVFGDDKANAIEVRDSGDGTVTATIDGHSVTAEHVRKIEILAGGGKDTLDYELTGPLEVREKVVADLGRGADSAKFDYSAGIAEGGHLRLNVRGGRGNDRESVRMGDVAEGGSARIDLHGGPGADSIAFRATGTVNGHLFVNTHANRHDHDTIVTHVEMGPHGRLVVK